VGKTSWRNPSTLACLLIAVSLLVTAARAADFTGELVNRSGTIYWLQNGKYYGIPNFDVINEMTNGGIPNWKTSGFRTVSSVPCNPCLPLFYSTTSNDSNGLLLKVYRADAIYLIENRQKRFLSSSEFTSRGFRFEDVISVTQGIINKFPDAPPPPPPTAVISMSAQGQTVGNNQTLTVTAAPGASVSVSFNASGSSAGSGSITAYEWRSNGAVIGTSNSFSFSFGTPSNDITLKVTNSAGGTNTASAKVIVQFAAPPTAAISMSGGGQSGGNNSTLTYSVPPGGSISMQFNANSSAAGSGTITSYEWRSNNTIISNQSSFGYSFAAASHTITLKVTNSFGVSNTATATIIVNTASPDFSISATPASATITQGERATYTVTVQSQNGFNSSVGLSGHNLPGGQVLSGTGFAPQTVTPSANNTVTSLFTFVSNNATPTGTFTITVRGAGGGLTRETTVSLTVNPAPVTPVNKSLIRLSGNETLYWFQNNKYYGVVNESVLNAMKGAGVPGWAGSVTTVPSLSPYTRGPDFVSANPSSNGLLVKQYNGPATVYRINNGKKEPLSLPEFNCRAFGSNDVIETAQSLLDAFPAQAGGDFTVSAAPSPQAVRQGESVSYTITVQSRDCFNGSVGLSALNLPGNRVLPGTVFNPNSVSPSPNGTATSTFTLVTDGQTPTGNFTITFRGVSGSLVRETTASLTVSPQPGPVLSKVEPLSPPVAGQQFLARVEGTGFNPNTIQVVALGPGCPNANSCVVNNDVLQGKSSTRIDSAPLKLGEGTYQIHVRNGSAGALSTGFPLTVNPAPPVIANKSLIKLNSNPTIYWFQNNKYYGIFPESVLNTMKSAGLTGWTGNVTTVPSLSSFTQGPLFISTAGSSNGLLIKQAGAAAVYLITSNDKREFLSRVQFEQRGFRFEDVIEVPPSILNLFMDTSLPAPTIARITPSPVPPIQPTVLTVEGTNFQNGFSAFVTTPLGTYRIADAGLTRDNSNQVRVQVEMKGTPPYTANLRIANPDGQTASRDFQVEDTGTQSPVITNISPNPVPFNQEVELVVTGSNFQSGFAVRIFSPDGNPGGDDILNEGLRFINANQVRVKVFMRGSPPYTARLFLINLNRKSAEANFQVYKPTVNPVFDIQPAAGALGTTFINTGRGFAPNSTLRLKVRWENRPPIENIIKQTDDKGFFSYPYVSKPDDPLGTHTIEVADASGAVIASDTVRYTNAPSGDAMSVTAQATPQVKVNTVTKAVWRIKNAGTTTWTGYKLVFVSSPADGNVSKNLTTTNRTSFDFPAAFKPGEEGDVSLDMRVSEGGTHFSYWQLQNAAGQTFGAQFFAQLTATASAKSNRTPGNPSGGSGTGDSPPDKAKTESDPVNTANGNYIYDREDLRVPGRGVDFVFSRAYNSADNTPSPLGNGWSHSFNIYLLDTGTSNPVVHYSDGKVLEYETGSSGNYVPRIPGFYDTLVKNPDGSWTLLKPDQRNYNFDSGGRLTSVQDRNSNLLSLRYDSEGKLQEVTDTVGRSFVFGYQGQRLASLTDPINRTLNFEYNGAGNLSLFKDANGNTTRYEYDPAGRITRIIDGRSNNLLVNEYDAEGRVKVQYNGLNRKYEFAYDTENKVTTITDPTGQTVKDRHDELFNLSTTTNKLGQTASIGSDPQGNRSQVSDLNGGVYSNSWDTRGNMISSVNPNQRGRSIKYDVKNNPMEITDELSRQTKMSYDAKGNLMKLTDAKDQAVEMAYNSFGQPETVKDPNGNVTRLEYDNQGNLVKVTDALGKSTTFEYDGVGRRTKVADARGKATSFVYDNNNNVVSVTDPSSRTTTYVYDQNNNLIEARDARGKLTRYEYDANNLLVKEINALSETIEHTYDELDRRISTKDKRGNVTRFGYDKEGRLISVEDPNGHTTRYEYDANGNRTKVIDPKGQATEFTYDAINRLVKIKDPLGNTIERKYDEAGQLKEETDPRSTPQNPIVTKFDYDKVGNLEVVTDAAQGTVRYGYDKNRNRVSVEDPNKRVSKMTYDKLNRVETSEDPLANKYVYTYDEVGNRKTMTDAKKQVIKYDYDDNNRLSVITYPDTSTVKFKYDENGNVLEMTDSLGVTKYVYDDLNRVKNYTDAYGKTIGYEYDENGNVRVLTYPDGKRVTYGYDKGNRMISVTDWSNRVTRYEYDERNLVTKMTHANGTTATYTYDTAGRLIGLVNAKSNGEVISSYSYVLDKNSNRLSATIREPLPPRVATPPQSAAFDEANRIRRAGASTFTFDANGNMTSKTTGGVTTAFTWDFNDRLIAVGNSTQYFYNGVGVRLGRREGTKVARYVVDMNRELSQVLCETDENGTITSYYIYGTGLLVREGNSKTYYYHFDSIGSAVAMTDSAQAIANRYSYSLFGRPTGSFEATHNPFKYLGGNGVLDDGNGIYYVRARYYLGDLGRFMTRDPLSGDSSNGQAINKYIYGLNNPLSFGDFDGLAPISLARLTQSFNKAFLEEVGFGAMEAFGKSTLGPVINAHGFDRFGQLATGGYRALPFIQNIYGVGMETYDTFRNPNLDITEKLGRVSLRVAHEAIMAIPTAKGFKTSHPVAGAAIGVLSDQAFEAEYYVVKNYIGNPIGNFIYDSYLKGPEEDAQYQHNFDLLMKKRHEQILRRLEQQKKTQQKQNANRLGK
jgi:RHS repeat-associated protein